ncbi:hypothetical protein GCM10023188_26170 [Pontibacter saemangeumensis]|uniref:Uncharacterized protein n=1 Tax=Pontibacter saemangeumensis TaxID=1084525 RepID=A0ABP8LU93_9BACT
MESNILYYSTNTKIAFRINQDYYHGKHFVWCCPVFNPSAEHRHSKFADIPPSSNPHNIYCRLKEDIKGRDRDSSKIKANKRGLKAGAAFKLKEGVITESQYGEIVHMINKASFEEFTPYIYVIREDMVNARVNRVSVKKTANPLGVEYQIADLDKSEFEILDIQL